MVSLFLEGNETITEGVKLYGNQIMLFANKKSEHNICNFLRRFVDRLQNPLPQDIIESAGVAIGHEFAAVIILIFKGLIVQRIELFVV